MKIKIEIPYNHFLIITPDNDSGALLNLLKAIANSQLVTSEGYGKDIKWKQADPHSKVTMEIVDDSAIITPHNAIKTLTDSVEAATQNWLKEYKAKETAEASLKELQDKIKALGITVQ